MKQKLKIKQFVNEWIDSYEPDTFVKDINNRLMYTSGHSTLNLNVFFEELLNNFIEENNIILK